MSKKPIFKYQVCPKCGRNSFFICKDPDHNYCALCHENSEMLIAGIVAEMFAESLGKKLTTLIDAYYDMARHSQDGSMIAAEMVDMLNECFTQTLDMANLERERGKSLSLEEQIALVIGGTDIDSPNAREWIRRHLEDAANEEEEES